MANPQVAALLKPNQLAVYGRDLRGVDGQAWVIRRGADRKGGEIVVGMPCTGASGCVEPPAGVQALRERLQALESRSWPRPSARPSAPDPRSPQPMTRRTAVAGGLGAAGAAAILSLSTCRPRPPPADDRQGVGRDAFGPEVFGAGALDAGTWAVVSEGDFRDKQVEVSDQRPPPARRLRVRCDTIGTDDGSVKFLGVRRRRPLRLSLGTRVGVDVDWNNQTNGSYLSAGLVLSPVETDTNPLRGPTWLQLEYVGVPPGRHGRGCRSTSFGRSRSHPA